MRNLLTQEIAEVSAGQSYTLSSIEMIFTGLSGIILAPLRIVIGTVTLPAAMICDVVSSFLPSFSSDSKVIVVQISDSVKSD